VTSLTKRLIRRGLPIFDVLLAGLMVPCAGIMRAFRRIGGARLPLSLGVLRTFGIYPITDHYYEPLFNPIHLGRDPREPRSLPGIDLREDAQVQLLAKLSFADELRELKLDQPSQELGDFWIENDSFGSGDAEFLYQFIRLLKPRRVIEVGSGHSTKLARLALERNLHEDGIRYEHTCIEPFEVPWLEQLGVRVLRCKVEDCPSTLFDGLASGDLLFIDSSHIIRPQGDVLHLYLTVLPQLRTGVFVHVHDIFTPADYTFLRAEHVANIRFWNEQYLLETLLTHSRGFETVAALNWLHHTHYDALKRVCPYLHQTREPGSFYIRALGQSAGG
jgi:hypothetical protein